MVLLATLLVSMLAPMAAPQETEPTHCPGSSGAVGGASETIPHFDMTLDNIEVGTGTGSDFVAAPTQGVFRTVDTNGTSQVVVRFEVVNVGDRNATRDDGPDHLNTTTKVTLAVVGGPGVTKTVKTDTPKLGSNTVGEAVFDVATIGRHTITFALNPDKDPKEECEDQAPAPGCIPNPCTQTYYKNNGQGNSTHAIIDAKTDLTVSGLDVTPPERPDKENKKSTEAAFRPTITNEGDLIAFALGTTTPTSPAGRFKVNLTVDECADCSTLQWTVDALDAGASRTLEEKTLRLIGVVGDYNVTILVDAEEKTYDPERDNNEIVFVERMPTPQLEIELDVDAPLVDGIYVIPLGQELWFNVTINNAGDGPAMDDDGSGFQNIAYRDSTSNNLLNEFVVLDAFEAVTFSINATNISGSRSSPHELTVRVDLADDVLEGNEDDNIVSFQAFAAVYEHELGVKEADARTEIPPGVSAKVPFELTNEGTVSDTYRLIAPADQRGITRYLDVGGNVVSEVRLDAGSTFKGQFERDIPRTATKGTVYNASIQVQSVAVGNTSQRAVSFTVGDDTVAPTITVEDPSSGFLSGNRAILRVTDNVNVTKVETDASGSFVTIPPEAEGSTLYAVDLSGQPGTITFVVKAHDAAGNVAEREVTLTRDENPPRISDVSFTPNRGVLPGDVVTVVVTLIEDHPDTVSADILQRRGIGETYRENRDLERVGPNFQIRQWVVPDRPGRYQFNITAADAAGNTATTRAILNVTGLNLRAVSERPAVSTQDPEIGQRVTLNWAVENTNPAFASGEFFVQLGADNTDTAEDATLLGVQRINLEPGQRQLVSFEWTVDRGPTDFTLAVDRPSAVDEDNELDNFARVSTEVIWPDSALFESQTADPSLSSFGQRVQTYWFVPTLFVAVVVLGIVALALGRRNPA